MIDRVIVVCPRDGLPEASLLGRDVAGLPLVTRSLLTARQAGVGRLVVVSSPEQRDALQPRVVAASRLDEYVDWVGASADVAPSATRSVVMIPTVVLSADALQAWAQRVDPADDSVVIAGSEAGPWAVPAARLAACIHAAREGLEGLERFAAQLRSQGRLRAVPWEGGDPETVRSAGDVAVVERRMLRAQRRVEDGPLVDRFVNRRLSAPITRLAVRWPVTPNQVSVLSLLTGLLAAWLLAHDGAAATLCGLVLFQFSVVLDHVDGEVARLTFQFSALGKWLDNFGDHAVDLAVILGVAWRVAVTGTVGSATVLAAAAVIGVTGSFLVVFWWSLSPRGPSVGGNARRSAETLGSMANRDGFCLALWATLLAGRPDWFVWTLAIGSNIYWLAWLVVRGVPARARGAA